MKVAKGAKGELHLGTVGMWSASSETHKSVIYKLTKQKNQKV